MEHTLIRKNELYIELPIYYKIEIVYENDSFKLGKSKGNKRYSINYSTDVNVYLIGNRWVPTAGGKISLTFKDKYEKPFMSIGTATVGYGFYDLNNGFFNVSPNAGYNFRMGYNLNENKVVIAKNNNIKITNTKNEMPNKKAFSIDKVTMTIT